MTNSLKTPGSARDSRAGFGDSPKHLCLATDLSKEESALARSPSLAATAGRVACVPRAIAKRSCR